MNIYRVKRYEVKIKDDERLFLDICNSALCRDTKTWKVIYKVRNTLYKLTSENRHFIIKCFSVPSAIKRIYYSFFGKSKAYRAYHNGLKIQDRGDYTADVIGYLEVFEFGLIKESFFLSEELSGYSEIRKQMKGIDLTEEFLESLINFIVEIHKKGIYHKDLSPGNILYMGEDYDFKIVDINRVEFFDSELSFEKSALSLYRLSDGRWEILSDISRRYALKRGFDVEQFHDMVSELADSFFIKKMYKWSIRRPEKPHKNKFAYVIKLLFFVFCKWLRHLLKKGHFCDKIKSFETDFYSKYLKYNDVRCVMPRKEGYKIKTL